MGTQRLKGTKRTEEEKKRVPDRPLLEIRSGVSGGSRREICGISHLASHNFRALSGVRSSGEVWHHSHGVSSVCVCVYAREKEKDPDAAHYSVLDLCCVAQESKTSVRKDFLGCWKMSCRKEKRDVQIGS